MGSSMVYGVLFGSRMLPQTAHRFVRGVSNTTSTLSSRVVQPVARPTTLATASLWRPVESKALTASSQVVGLPRFYGTRSVWNVASGRRQLWIWFVAATAVAGFVQEVCGPYIFFHE